MTGCLQRHLEAWRSGFEYARYIERLMIHYSTESEETTMPTDPSTLRREAATLLAEANRIESRPKDIYPEGTVLTFTKPGRYRHAEWNKPAFDGQLKYAAIKAGDRHACWFLTGREHYAKTWEQLLDFIGKANLSTVRAKTFHSGVLPYPSHQW